MAGILHIYTFLKKLVLVNANNPPVSYCELLFF